MKHIGQKTNTLELLEKYNLKALKKYGQNFLVDENILEKIAHTNDITNKNVIEIGPGLGALTEKIAISAKHVYAYEIDERMIDVLTHELESPNVNIIHQDFIKADLNQLPNHKYIVVTNLPYYITSDIIKKVITSSISITHMTALIQKEVALKLIHDISPLSLMIQSAGSISYAFTVSSHVFMPKPHVDSAVISIERHNVLEKDYILLLERSFAQKRKTLVNNLKTYYSYIERILTEIHISIQIRPHELNVDMYKLLYERIKNHEN